MRRKIPNILQKICGMYTKATLISFNTPKLDRLLKKWVLTSVLKLTEKQPLVFKDSNTANF
jgi:hypothetical protein